MLLESHSRVVIFWQAGLLNGSKQLAGASEFDNLEIGVDVLQTAPTGSEVQRNTGGHVTSVCNPADFIKTWPTESPFYVLVSDPQRARMQWANY